MKYFVAFLSALLFGLGLGISGMTDPSKVIGFLDLFGNWQPALMLVMGGAIGFHAISYYLIKKRATPLLGGMFLLPTKKHVDGRLVIGSALFGIGWGIGGYCPGPAIASLVTMSTSVMIFVLAMLGGIALFHYLFKPYFLGGK